MVGKGLAAQPVNAHRHPRGGEQLRTTSHGRWMPTSSFSLRQQGTATHASSSDHGSRSLRGLPVCRARPATIAVVPNGRVRNSTVTAGSADWASARSADGL
jgi:hypothetical protein